VECKMKKKENEQTNNYIKIHKMPLTCP